MFPPLLVFDSATDRLAVALVVGDRLFSADEPGSERASARLLVVIDALLRQAGLDVADVAGIGFGRGPGAFTGLRAACTVAQGLALARGLPVLPLDTLSVVAQDARRRALERGEAPPADVRVIQDARMGELYSARCAWTDAGWQPVEPAAVMGPEAWNALHEAQPGAAVVGSALAAFGPGLRTGSAWIDPDAVPSSAALADCLRQAWRAGVRGAAADALPLYVRDKVAETTVERAARRDAAAASPASAQAAPPAPARA